MCVPRRSWHAYGEAIGPQTAAKADRGNCFVGVRHRHEHPARGPTYLATSGRDATDTTICSPLRSHDNVAVDLRTGHQTGPCSHQAPTSIGPTADNRVQQTGRSRVGYRDGRVVSMPSTGQARVMVVIVADRMSSMRVPAGGSS